MHGGVSTSPPPQNPLSSPRPQATTSSSSTIATTATSSSSLSSSSQSDFELISIKPLSYISLRDLLPSMAVNSPRPMRAHQPGNPVQSPGSEISIRNPLVKQAAWAYLQPMSTSPGSASRSFLHRLLGHTTPLPALLGFFNRHILPVLTRSFSWFLRAFRARSSR